MTTETKRIFQGRRGVLLASLTAAVLGGCAVAAPLLPDTVHVSEADLLRSVSDRFPIDRRLLEVVNITVANPRLKLLPRENRLASEFEVSALDRFFSNRPLKGSLSLTYGLRFEPADGTIRLAQVRVDQFLFDGVPEMMRSRLDRVGSVLAEQMLEDMTVHTVKPERLARARELGFVPGAIRVVEGGVDLKLERAPAR